MSSTQSSIFVINNLPNDITIDELRKFLSNINIIHNGGVRIIPASNNDDNNNDDDEISLEISSSSLSSKIIKMNAYIFVENEIDIINAINICNKKLFRNRYQLNIKKTTKKFMEKELRYNISNYIKNNLIMKCEWIDCNKLFNDRSLYLQHINEIHLATYYNNNQNNNKIIECKWQGCNDDNFATVNHLRIHLSLHAYHNQLMNIGQQIMNITIPKLICYLDNPERNLLSETFQEFICGWNNCNGEFNDAETFFQHVDYHAIEDVTIPMVSKEKLKKIRFARCQWINCQASFKKKSHLKMHLHSHTQRKLVACPVCGELFSTRIAFINHCYRQETPTLLSNDNNNDNNQQIIEINKNDKIIDIITNINQDDDDERILTIDEEQIHQQTNDNLIELTTIQQQKQEQEQEIQREFKCNKCIKSFHTSTLLREHENKHIKKFKCKYCQYNASHQSRLNEHILYRHSDQYDYHCQFCQQRFKCRRSLQRHIESHKSNKKNSCQICEQKFTSFYSLKRHFRIKHLNDIIIFECHLCNKKYNRGNNLSRHLINKHQLKVANGWTGFSYIKQQQQKLILTDNNNNQNDDNDQQQQQHSLQKLANIEIYRINLQSCVEKNNL